METREKDAFRNKRKSVFKAMKRMEHGVPNFFTGESALNEVAKEDGDWNWALVGPDPSNLPLAGGGSGGVQEMRGAMAKHAHSFGLIRLTFGLGAQRRTKFIFVHVTDLSGQGKFSVAERGQAMLVAPKMEAALQRFAAISAKVHIDTPENLSVSYFIQELRFVRGVDNEILTEEMFKAGEQAHMEQVQAKTSVMTGASKVTFRITEKPDEEGMEPQRSLKFLQKKTTIMDLATVVEEMTTEAPTATEAAEPEPAWGVEEEPARQRKKVKLYAIGDVVEVYSIKEDKWILDAEITEVVTENVKKDGFKLRAGSMKVVYAAGARFKWVAPQQVETYLRPSPRPKPPASVIGKLLLQVHDASVSHWNMLHLEMNKGFLQWWDSKEDAQQGSPPLGSIYLMGLAVKDDSLIIMLSARNTEGAVYAFKGETLEEVGRWVEALWEHAGYCEEMQELLLAQRSGKEVRTELLDVMRRKSLAAA